MKKYILIDYIMVGDFRVVVVAKRREGVDSITIVKNIQNKGNWREGEETYITPHINTITFESDDLQEVIDTGVLALL